MGNSSMQTAVCKCVAAAACAAVTQRPPHLQGGVLHGCSSILDHDGLAVEALEIGQRLDEGGHAIKRGQGGELVLQLQGQASIARVGAQGCECARWLQLTRAKRSLFGFLLGNPTCTPTPTVHTWAWAPTSASATEA